MLAKRLVIIAACVALSLDLTAAHQSKIHISVRSHEKSNGCGGGNLVTIGDLGSFCTHAGTPCSGSTEGVCPPSQPALENGSTCTKLSSGEYGCVANAATTFVSNSTSSTASKSSSSEDSASDVAESESESSESSGSEEASTESESDSAEDSADSFSETEAVRSHKQQHQKAEGCDGILVAVVGKGKFCAAGNTACEGYNIGSCPGRQPGLENGSSCTKHAEGYFGCLENSESFAAFLYRTSVGAATETDTLDGEDNDSTSDE